MSATGERGEAMAAAERGEFANALRRAENINEGWYRCQALAAAARFAPEGDVLRVANKALKAAQEAGDAYKRVAVSAWPVRALVERGKNNQVQKVLANLIAEAEQIMPPVSRVCALELVLQAAWPLPANVKQSVLDALLAACRADNSWKGGRILSYLVLMVASEDAEQARRIAHSMREGHYKRRAQKRLDAGQTETVRSFFHRRTAQEEAERQEWLEASKKRSEAWAKRSEERDKQHEERANLMRQQRSILGNAKPEKN